MIRFDYERLFIAAHGDPDNMLKLFKRETYGPNFILNPEMGVASSRHKAEYLGFCALRSYTEYLDSGLVDVRLDLVPPHVPLEIVEDNPLLKLTNNSIQLLREKIHERFRQH